jgi:hypothetical protein
MNLIYNIKYIFSPLPLQVKHIAALTAFQSGSLQHVLYIVAQLYPFLPSLEEKTRLLGQLSAKLQMDGYERHMP